MAREDIQTLNFTNDREASKIISCGYQGHIYAMQVYIIYLHDKGIDDFNFLTQHGFHDFRLDVYDPEVITTPPITKKKDSSLTSTCQSADDFKRGIKRDKTHYIVFKENTQWDNW